MRRHPRPGRDAACRAWPVESIPSPAGASEVEFGVPYYAKFKGRRKRDASPVKEKKKSPAGRGKKRLLIILVPLLFLVNFAVYRLVQSRVPSLPSLTDDDFSAILLVDSVRTAGATVYLRSVREWAVEEEGEELEGVVRNLGDRAVEAGYKVLVLMNPGGEIIGSCREGNATIHKAPKNT